MALEGVEIAQARGPQDGWAKDEVRPREDRLVIRVGGGVTVDDLSQCLHAEPAREVIVERGDRLAEERRVMCPPRILDDQSLARVLEVEPVPRARVMCRRQAPGRARRRVALADVRDPHGIGV